MGQDYGNLTVICRIAGDKVDNTIWRVENLALSCGIEYAVIICGPITPTITKHLAS